MDHNLATSRPQPQPTGRSVTTADLFASQLRGPAHLVEPGPQTLVVGGVPIATVGPDAARLNPMTATSADGMPAVEILAAIAAQDPSGVLVIELPRETGGFGFALDHGRVTAARGPGRLGQLERWCAEVHQRFPRRFGNHPPDASGALDPLWLDMARNFIRENALEFLEGSLAPGTRLTLLRGDIHWIGTQIPRDRGPGLQHLLLEQARRHDELPGLLAKLGATTQVALPMHEPGEGPPGQAKTELQGEDDWSFDEPDPATLEAWADARKIWALCDGQHTIEELVERAMLGRFRTLKAMSLLAKEQNIIVIASPTGRQARAAKTRRGKPTPPPLPAANSRREPSVAKPIPLHARPIAPPPAPATAPPAAQAPRPASPPPPPIETPRPALRATPEVSTGYSMTRKAAPGLRTKNTAPKRRVEQIPTKRVVTPEAIVASREASASSTLPRPPSPEFDVLVDAEVSALDLAAFASDEPAPLPTPASAPTPTRAPGSWQLIALAVLGALLFVGGAAFALMLSRS